MMRARGGNAIHARFQLRYPSSTAATFALDVDLTAPGNGITAIFGQSGSGKTTLLRCIAGLEMPDEGHLTVNGDTWQSPAAFTPTHERALGYVFQEASLFPHLTAKGNLHYAVKRSGAVLTTEMYDRVLAVMGIEPVLHRYPDQLSGGERQRVAIARALLIQPRLLLMDEPLASLDAARKQEILPYLERLRSAFDIPMLYVSHSMDEVARLADHAVVLDHGQIVAQGNVADVFSRLDLPLPGGEDAGVILAGRVVERDAQWQLMRVAFAGGGELWVRDGGDALNQTVRLRVLARDVSLALAPHDDSSILNRLPVEVVEINGADEAMAFIRLKAGGEYLIAQVTRRSVAHLQLAPGKAVWAQIKSVAIVR